MEGDALGSVLAFYRLLKALGKRVDIVAEDSVPYPYRFLPGIAGIKKVNKKIIRMNSGCLVTLDCADLTRCGRVAGLVRPGLTVLNIDHHASNTRFGNVNWVEPQATSCTHMLYKLYKRLRLPLDRDTALFLYVGLLTDTGSFHYQNTTEATHRVAAELLKYNLDVTCIYRSIYENIPFQDLKLLSRILLNIRSQCSGQIIWFQVGRNLIREREAVFDLSEEVLKFGRLARNAEAVVFFKESPKNKKEIRVNLRSQGRLDVNKIARFFGGGGHKAASGITMHGSLEEVARRVLGRIRESLK